MSENIKNKTLEEIELIIRDYKNYTKSYRYSGTIYSKEFRIIMELFIRINDVLQRNVGLESNYNPNIKVSIDDPKLREKLNLKFAGLNAFYINLKNEYINIKHTSTSSLEYDNIIDEEIEFKDEKYNEVVYEINETYRCHFFTSMYILVRKLLENSIIDCIKNFYGMNDIDKFFDINRKRHHSFSTLRANFNEMIKKPEFKAINGEIDQKFVDLLDIFKITGNINAHSLFNLTHQKIIEENKEQLNIFIKKIITIS